MLRKVLGLCLIVSLDVAAGLITPHILARWQAYELLWWHYGIGVWLALFPDYDFAFSLGKEFTSEHRSKGLTFHWPLVTIPVVAGLAWTVDPFWGHVATIVLLCHFVHDSIGWANRWGVHWLAPFQRDFFLLLAPSTEGSAIQLIVRTPETTAKPLTLSMWMETYYLHLTGESIASALALLAALAVVFLF